MTDLKLIPHPMTGPGPVTDLTAGVITTRSGMLTVAYVLLGDTGRIRLPFAAEPARKDDLWRRTCFEAFVGGEGRPDYFEFNFAPSSEWAAYKFKAYREGGANAEGCAPPQISVSMHPRKLSVTAEFDIDAAMKDMRNSCLRLGLSAVIEELSGAKFYWALAHPCDRPDFHHPAGFTHNLKIDDGA